VVNLGWENPHDVKEIATRLKVKTCWVDNDANMGCFGEWAAGAGKGTTACYGLFVGTGLGGGYILNGELVSGPGHHAGEVGHTCIDLRKKAQLCGCGKTGCVETYSSKVRIVLLLSFCLACFFSLSTSSSFSFFNLSDSC